MDRKRQRRAMSLTAVALVLTACGSGDPDYTFSGFEVVEVQSSLADLERLWRDHVGAAEVEIRLGDDARCYFQVAPEVEGSIPISNQAFCGPYREMGSEATSWDVADLMAFPSGEEDTLRITAAPDADDGEVFEQGSARPNLTPHRPDGGSPDLAAVVEEPDAPVAAAGEPVSLPSAPSDLVEIDSVRTPTAQYHFSRGEAERVSSEGGPLQAAEGGGFVIYTVRADLPWMGEEEGPEPTIEVRSGDESVQIPAEAGVYAVPVGDPSGAELRLTFDGLTQAVGPDGARRADTRADLLYAEQPTITVAPLEAREGVPGEDGWHAGLSTGWSGPAGELAVYDEGLGWAPEGQLWLRIAGDLRSEGASFREGWSASSYSDQRVDITSVRLGSEEVEELTIEASADAAHFVAIHPVTPNFDEEQVEIDAVLTVVRNQENVEGSPERADFEFTLSGPVSG